MPSGGGQQPVTQQTTQTRDPWSAAQPHLTGMMNAAANLYGGNLANVPNAGVQTPGYLPFADNTTANWLNTFNTPGVQAINNMAVAEPYGSANLANARGMLGDLVSNQGLSSNLS